MKINKRDIRHWYYLMRFTLNVWVALLIRPFVSKSNNRFVLYGHKLNGNLAALYDFVTTYKSAEFEMYVLCFDPIYYKQLRSQGIRALSAIKFKDVLNACRAKVIVTDHGPHALFFLNIFTNTIFIDVWHGIPFKNFTDQDFYYIKKYAAIFVVSETMKDRYIRQFGIPPSKIIVTGYGRTDKLVSGKLDRQTLLKKYNLPTNADRRILYAPTWSHDAGMHSLAACSMEEVEFIHFLSQIADSLNCTILLRAHINTISKIDARDNVFVLGAEQYPDTEEILLFSDVLITDWSSIAFDYLLLLRPTIFIEREMPFINGFGLGPQRRFGRVVSDRFELGAAIRLAASSPDEYLSRYGSNMKGLIKEIYGGSADGSSSARYLEAIRGLNAPAG